MLIKTESAFWQSIAWILGIVLAICVLANVILGAAVPHQFTLLLFGSLVALGIGGAILNPRTSPVWLPEEEETHFRQRQYIVGVVISTILALLMILTDLGKSAMAWLFAPVILLPYALLIRERVRRGQSMMLCLDLLVKTEY